MKQIISQHDAKQKNCNNLLKAESLSIRTIKRNENDIKKRDII